jgi:hypothetical protein
MPCHRESRFNGGLAGLMSEESTPELRRNWRTAKTKAKLVANM